MSEGVDYAFPPHPSARGLAEVGKTFAMRYVGLGSAGKHLSGPERDELHAAGLSIVLLAEGTTNRALDGYLAGQTDARRAATHARDLGAPGRCAIYFAVDFDCSATQWPRVRDYLRGCVEVLGLDRVGVYGGVNVVEWAARDHAARWLFQTYAWSGGVWWSGNHVEQYRNGVSLVGGTVDLDRSRTVDFGQWRPSETPGEDETVTITDEDAIKIARTVAGLAYGRDDRRHTLAEAINTTYDVVTHTDVNGRLSEVRDALVALDGQVPADLAAKLDALMDRMTVIANAPLIDAVQVAAAIAAHPDILGALASGVAGRLATLGGEITLSGSFTGGITGPAQAGRS